jgi:hypothetical protein
MTRCESESDSRPRPCASVSSESESLRLALTASGPGGLARAPPSRDLRGHPGAAHLVHWHLALRGRGPGPQAQHWQARVGHRDSDWKWQAGQFGPEARKEPLMPVPGPLRVPFRPRDPWLHPSCLPVPAISIMILQQSRTLACDDHDRTVTRTVRANRTRRLRAGARL